MTDHLDLVAAAAVRKVKVPTKRTLDKYGLTEVEWLQLLHDQGWCCAVCRRAHDGQGQDERCGNSEQNEYLLHA